MVTKYQNLCEKYNNIDQNCEFIQGYVITIMKSLYILTLYTGCKHFDYKDFEERQVRQNHQNVVKYFVNKVIVSWKNANVTISVPITAK